MLNSLVRYLLYIITLTTFLFSQPDIEWEQTYYPTNTAQSISATSDGGYIISSDEDSRLLKIENAGNEEWSYTYNGGNFSELFDVDECLDGGFIATGFKHNKFYLLKTDSNGNILFERLFGQSGQQYAKSVEETSDGGFILAGKNDNNGFVVKTNSNADSLWAHTYSSGEWLEFEDIKKTQDGIGYIMAGYTRPSSNNR